MTNHILQGIGFGIGLFICWFVGYWINKLIEFIKTIAKGENNGKR